MKKLVLTLCATGLLSFASAAEIKLVGAEKLNEEYINCATEVVSKKAMIEENHDGYLKSIGTDKEKHRFLNFKDSMDTCLAYFYAKDDTMLKLVELNKSSNSYYGGKELDKSFSKLKKAEKEMNDMLSVLRKNKGGV